MTQPTLIELSGRLAKRETTSRALIEESLARIADPKGEGARAFLSVHAERACAEADAIDAARSKGVSLPRFAGVPLSIKDLFDVEGEPTRAGSRALAGAPAALADAEAVKLARRAGCLPPSSIETPHQMCDGATDARYRARRKSRIDDERLVSI
jgi:aspartyl-tRNA(Asn)/glutamyl-tRNA(Gln) amidotransferase subunit A